MTGIYRHITTTIERGVLVMMVNLREVKDYMVAEELRTELVHAVRSTQTKKYVLDLHNMTFMTSLACVAFIGLKHSVRDGEGRLILCDISDFIRKVFNAKRLLTPSQSTGSVAFEEAENRAEAIQRLNGESPSSKSPSSESPSSESPSSESPSSESPSSKSPSSESPSSKSPSSKSPSSKSPSSESPSSEPPPDREPPE